MQLIDTHNHVDFPEFDHDRDQLLSHAKALGVARQIVLGVCAPQWPRLWQLVTSTQGEQAGLYAAFGLHPVYLADHPNDAVQRLELQLSACRQHPRLCAVGEIGLDYFVPTLDRQQQGALFIQQLELAKQFELPALLHVRRAHADTLAALKQVKLPRGGIVHAFAGSVEEAREYRKLGFLLGFGGAATWPQAKRLRRVLAALPAEQLVLETDAPDMAPVFLAGQRNSPTALAEISERLAAVRGVSVATLAQQCTANTCALFGWSAL